MTAEPDPVRGHARDVLQDVLRWQLTADGWARVSATLDKLEAGLGLTGPDQMAALTMASVELELSAPERLTAIDKLAAPVPDRVRERVNVLVHELAPPAGPGTDETSGAGG